MAFAPDRLIDFRLSIAGIGAVLHVKSRRFAARLGGRVAPFREPHAVADVQVDVEIVPGRAPGAGSGRFTLDEHTLVLEGPGFEGRYDRVERRGAIRQTASVRIFERFLAGIWALELPGRDGILLHSAALRRRDAAFAFFGPSGSGKTTLARRRSADVLSDEVVAVVAGAHGATAYGTPWRGGNSSGRLTAMFLLARSGVPSVTRLGDARAAHELLRNAFLPLPDRSLGTAALRAVQRLVEVVPVFELSVVRGRPFWPLVEAALAEART